VGESKEVGQYANRLDLPIAIVDKRRYGDDENLRATNLIGDVKGKVALIIDDEVAGGGTLMEATRFVLKRGPSRWKPPPSTLCSREGPSSGSKPHRCASSW